MNQIPSWFINARKDVWRELSPFIGKPVTRELVKEVEKKVNNLINSWNFTVTNQGKPVFETEFTTNNGKISINFK